MIDTTPPVPKAILVGITLTREDPLQTQAHLEELAELARTRGIEPAAVVTQRREKFSTRTKIGKGKVEELAAMVQAEKIDSVLFDDELTPSQLRNLEKELNCKVWDRTLLILEIFALHARTVQARTQVELAQYQYLLPRLTRMWTHLSRQGGGRGAGMQGTGEKELETDKRLVKEKIQVLKRKLDTIKRQTAVQRSQRKRYPNVALVGYTNAGKSTLMRTLSKADVLVENKLFATLTTTVRKVVIQQIPFLLSDTVGFIRKLPHTLVECFKTTLAEACAADLLLHVVDFSHPQFHEQIQIVHETLREIGAEKIPLFLIFNKIDILSKEKINAMGSLKEIESMYSKQYGVPVIAVSAQEKQGIAHLQERLYRHTAVIHQQLYPQNKALTSGPVVQWTE